MRLGETSGNPILDKRFAYALTYKQEGDYQTCFELLEQCLDASPAWCAALCELADCAFRLGAFKQCAHSLARLIVLDPDDLYAGRLMLARLPDFNAAPPEMGKQYVAELFNDFADHFEDDLVNRLAYHVPHLIQTALTAYSSPFQFKMGLDLGCGTGLMADALHPFTGELYGVDLSEKMIKIAHAKHLYRDLSVLDLNEYLAKNSRLYDLILAADVLVYLGDLQDLFQLIALRLAPKGVFAFTVQRLDGNHYCLGEDLRYHHSRDYVQGLILQNELKLISLQAITPRLDGGKPILGDLYLVEKR